MKAGRWLWIPILSLILSFLLCLLPLGRKRRKDEEFGEPKEQKSGVKIYVRFYFPIFATAINQDCKAVLLSGIRMPGVLWVSLLQT